MSSFLLKIIACITMFTDHVGYLIFHGKLSFMNYIGRIAFPIFAYQISEGYLHTKNLKKYLLRLLIFAIISQYPYMLFHNLISSSFALNIFFTLLLGLICIIIYDKLSNKFISLILCTEIAFIAELIHCDYGFWGIAVVLFFYIFKDKKMLMNLSFILLVCIKYFYRFYIYGFSFKTLWLFIGTLSPLIFINLYNKKQGRKIKYFLYIFYPVHLLLIYLIWNLIYV